MSGHGPNAPHLAPAELVGALHDRAEAATDECEHHWASRHEPAHIVYWVRTCTICHRVDWDDLDREVRLGVAKLLGDPGQSTANCENRRDDG